MFLWNCTRSVVYVNPPKNIVIGKLPAKILWTHSFFAGIVSIENEVDATYYCLGVSNVVKIKDRLTFLNFFVRVVT